MKSVLVLFPNEWDRSEFVKDKYAKDYKFIFYGPKLFDFPHPLTISQTRKLLFFSVERFIDKVTKKVKKENIDAVISSEEYIGAIVAAAVSQNLGLPGNNPSKMILCQHKYFSRLFQKEHFPEFSVNTELMSQCVSEKFSPALKFPFFVKPVKGTFSLYAKRINDEKELKKHLCFNWLERSIFNLINKPYNSLLKNWSDLKKGANYFVAEELMMGDQVTLDGFVYNGEAQICGIVDSVMYPGTNVFSRFEYPSRLDPAVQERMIKLVKELVLKLEFKNAQFNVELFYNAEEDKIQIIEVNPRLSYQFSELYENVDGYGTYKILLDLALGEKPSVDFGEGAYNYSTSFVIRTFEGDKLEEVPKSSHIESFCSRFPNSSVKVFGDAGKDVSEEMRSVGGYRCGIVNLGANTESDLEDAYQDALDSLPFSVS